jgi:hypothetical protein
LLSPRLNFPPVVHLKAAGPRYDDEWGRDRYELDLLTTAAMGVF